MADARDNREPLTYMNGNQEFSVASLRCIKLGAFSVSALMVGGIAALMVLAAGKGEDITGIVAPALLIAFVSGAVATVAAVLQKRPQRMIDTDRR